MDIVGDMEDKGMLLTAVLRQQGLMLNNHHQQYGISSPGMTFTIEL